MIGFNGGLIGKDRTTNLVTAPGVWTLGEQIKARRSSAWPVGLDSDASAYIAAVEAIDGALEDSVRNAIQLFVIGCKLDGIWSALKASCILCGAKSRTGALVPLVGSAPTSTGFVDADYDRKLGLKGNGTNKYLNTNRNNNADPQDSRHNAIYISETGTNIQVYLGASAATNSAGDTNIGRDNNALFVRNNAASPSSNGGKTDIKLLVTNRSAAASFVLQRFGITETISITSQTPFNGNIHIFSTIGGTLPSNARMAFYSIGESLDPVKLNARVNALVDAIGVAF